MTEEKKLILKMLKEGIITEDEAIKLLDAIKDPEDDKTSKAQNRGNKDGRVGFDTRDLERKFEKFTQNMASGIDNLVQKTSEKLRNLQFDYDFDMSYDGDSIISFGNMKSKIDRTYTIDLKPDKDINLDINNYNGNTKLSPSDLDKVQIRAYIKYNDRYVDENYEFVKYFFDGDSLVIKADSRDVKKEAFSVNMEVMLPKKIYKKVNLNSSNGNIELGGLEFEEVYGESANGSFWAYNLDARYLCARTVNGGVNVEDSKIKQVKLESVNGSLELVNLEGEILSADTVNGKINFEDLNQEDIQIKSFNGNIYIRGDLNSTRYLKVNSLNASVNIDAKDLNKACKLYCKANSHSLDRMNLGTKFDIIEKNRRELLATTHDYKEDDLESLNIEVKIQNGSINVNI